MEPESSSGDSPGNRAAVSFKKKKIVGCLCVVLVLTVAVCIWAGVEFYAYATKLDRLVMAHYQGKSRQFPARIYSRPLELYPGLTLEPDAFSEELSLLRYQTSDSLRFPGSQVH